MTREPITIERDLLESCLQLFEEMWADAPCGWLCDCILHSLRAALGVTEYCVVCGHDYHEQGNECEDPDGCPCWAGGS